MLAPLGNFRMVPMKSLLSGLTHMDAPESQMIVKLSFGSIAALQAMGCCSTTDSDSGHWQGQVAQVGGTSDGSLVGISDGSLAGIPDGLLAGILDGLLAGISDGLLAGISDGSLAGISNGSSTCLVPCGVR